MADQLLHHEDFRVRTQAALALGASKSEAAVDPLCKGLDDSNTTVRTASAAAMGKLSKGGTECLEAHLKSESSSGVKGAIKKALARLGDGDDVSITDSTKFYVGVGKATDKTGRGGEGVDQIVRRGLKKGASEAEGVVLAPPTESEAKAKVRLGKHKSVKGFYLLAKVSAPKYSGGTLTIKVELSIFTYPGKALKATLPLKLQQDGVSEGDTATEDALIEDAAARAMGKFLAKADSID